MERAAQQAGPRPEERTVDRGAAAGRHGRLSLDLPAVPASVPRARAAVAEFAAQAGVAHVVVENMLLAVSEAVTNAVLHAYLDREEPLPVTVSAELQAGGVWVGVADRGRGMQPRVDSPGLGLGLSIIARLADSLDLSPRPDGGTRVRMWFAT